MHNFFFDYRFAPDLELKTWNFCNPDFWIASLLFGVIERVSQELAGKCYQKEEI